MHWPVIRRIRLDAALTIALLVASLATNALLAKRVDNLNETITSLKEQGNLKKGEAVPPLVATTLNGTPAQIRYNDTSLDTLLYVFSPTCPWCKKNLPELHALISQSGSHYRVIGISLSPAGLQTYLQQNDLTIPVFTNVAAASRMKYQFGGTPETVVIAPDGHVKFVWIGSYQTGLREEIVASLGVSLPDCCG